MNKIKSHFHTISIAVHDEIIHLIGGSVKHAFSGYKEKMEKVTLLPIS